MLQLHMINDTSKYNWSVLHLAVFHGFDKLFLFLVSEGGDINIESRDGWDCLSLAIWQKNITSIYIMKYIYSYNIINWIAKSRY